MSDLCHDFSRLVADTRFEDLPAPAVEGAKKSILDTLGVILAASGMAPAVRGVADVVRESGGVAQSTVLGFGDRVPAAMAAFVNGAMAHCLDFDDRTVRGAHPSSSVVPAAFALAERAGGISGRRMIAAVAVGNDLFVRLRGNIEWRQDWNPSTVLGVFSATAAASSVLGLGREQAAHALGLAGMQASGTMEAIFGTGSDLRGLYAGFTAKAAVLSAQLAAKGVTGVDTLFEGTAGIFNTYFNGKYDRDGMVRDLGRDFRGAEMLYKPWPTVGVSHTYIHATSELMKQHGIHASDIEQIRVFVGNFHQRMCDPLEARRAPVNAVDAKFSLPFCIAIAAARGAVGISDFTPAALRDPAVLAMAQRVVPVQDSKLDWNTTPPDGRLQIITRSGQAFEGVGRDVPGSPEVPMTWDHLASKSRDCATVAAVPVSAGRIAMAQDLAHRLEALNDATELLRAIV